MHLTNSAVVAILGFSAVILAEIFPDPDPCMPYPKLPGEYEGEYSVRLDLDAKRCNCIPTGRAPFESRREFDERNRLDSAYCLQGRFIPLGWEIRPPPLPPLGIIVVPMVGGGPSWRDGPDYWRDPRWGRSAPPPPNWRGPRNDQPHRGGGRDGGGRDGRNGAPGRDGVRDGRPSSPGPNHNPGNGPRPGNQPNHNPPPQAPRPGNQPNHNQPNHQPAPQGPRPNPGGGQGPRPNPQQGPRPGGNNGGQRPGGNSGRPGGPGGRN